MEADKGAWPLALEHALEIQFLDAGVGLLLAERLANRGGPLIIFAAEKCDPGAHFDNSQKFHDL